ncbi:hypothetical protein N7466_006627 [Penicillium verhagenii]|uniref:uncharacterized protein n=1 Tax=Penicillium verhagenii TaxID=1562060 RepID=UPI0025458B65|nr:uncharacterized protein N7466_006627 [Penicillium verhagenii]KAJ5931134.1 hypothetical protein N7466_006627 [Penicillium verhagenii]
MEDSSSIWPSVRRWRWSQQEQGKRKPDGDYGGQVLRSAKIIVGSVTWRSGSSGLPVIVIVA